MENSIAVVLDWDYTLFDTFKMLTALARFFYQNYGIEEKDFWRSYREIRSRGNYDIQFHLDYFSLVENKNIACFRKDYSSYLFADTVWFLRKMRTLQIACLIYSCGVPQFQMEKIVRSGVKGYFKGFVFCKSPDKTEFLPQLSKCFETLFFVDDRLDVLKKINENFPKIRTFWIDREEPNHRERQVFRDLKSIYKEIGG